MIDFALFFRCLWFVLFYLYIRLNHKHKTQQIFFLFSAVSNPINLATIVVLTGSNYKKWRTEIELHLASLIVDHALTEYAPPPLTD